jgi:hypothetical protein
MFPEYRDLITQLKTTDSHFLNVYDKHNVTVRPRPSGFEALDRRSLFGGRLVVSANFLADTIWEHDGLTASNSSNA